MFFLLAFIKRKCGVKKEAFSLVEVMVAILILSMIMVAMTPVITRGKIKQRQSDGVIFTYGTSNSTKKNARVCFSTDSNNYNSTNVSYNPSDRCSEYTFVVPEGVNEIDLTLVGGGGGGGGASGSAISNFNKEIKGANIENISVDFDRLSELTINYLTSKGAEPQDIDPDTRREEYCGDVCSGDYLCVCGQEGGKSSAAISNFKITDILNLGSIPLNPLEIGDSGLLRTVVMDTTTNAAYIDLGGSIRYFINRPDNSRGAEIPVGCIINGTEYLAMETNFDTLCRLPYENILPEVEGQPGIYLKKNEKTTSATILPGGKGGFNSSPYGSFGSGANGNGTRTQCEDLNSCTNNGYNGIKGYDSPSSSTPGDAYASVSYTIETPGATGGGGSGGSVYRVTGFPVRAGETYTIRVGAGGEGGASGIKAIGDSEPTDGENGGGGTSTAIYDEDGNVIFMVPGGLGGEGGSAPFAGAHLPSMPQGLGYTPVVYSSNRDLIITNNADSKLVTMTGVTHNANRPAIAGQTLNGIRLEYPFMRSLPKSVLNFSSNMSVTSINGTNTTLSPFAAFDTNNVRRSSASNFGLFNTYNGLYFRSIIGNYPAYLGGLGGMSGLGTKAGCGGLFVGNNGEHTKADNTDEDDTNVLNTMIINDTLYKVSDYYDNCTLSTPDGQSANFILPTVNGPTFGSAGAGGGGGAWSPTLGAGKGGRGQDGYLMIEWRR